MKADNSANLDSPEQSFNVGRTSPRNVHVGHNATVAGERDAVGAELQHRGCVFPARCFEQSRHREVQNARCIAPAPVLVRVPAQDQFHHVGEALHEFGHLAEVPHEQRWDAAAGVEGNMA